MSLLEVVLIAAAIAPAVPGLLDAWRNRASRRDRR